MYIIANPGKIHERRVDSTSGSPGPNPTDGNDPGNGNVGNGHETSSKNIFHSARYETEHAHFTVSMICIV
jgi:hypothetical protein